MPASIAAASSRVSGVVRSTPLTAPTNTGWIWRIETMGASKCVRRFYENVPARQEPACSKHQCNSRNQQHDQHDLPECGFIEPDIEPQAEPGAAGQRRQAGDE